MKTTLSYLRAKNIFTKTENDFKHFLSEVWFETYSRGKRWANLNSISTKTKKNDQSTTFRIKGSSGFEHVFLGEKKLNKVQGFHSWLYFSFMEEKKKVFQGKNWSGCTFIFRSITLVTDRKTLLEQKQLSFHLVLPGVRKRNHLGKREKSSLILETFSLVFLCS